jgi:hypothetical protein
VQDEYYAGHFLPYRQQANHALATDNSLKARLPVILVRSRKIDFDTFVEDTRYRRNMKSSGLLFAAFLLLTCEAQTPARPALPPVPTTRILAIGSLKTPLTPEQRKSIMPKEVPDTVRLYLGGKIDQWYVRQDGKGVVFILNLSSVEEAHTMLESLPLGQAKLMTFELIPLGPLSPLALLLTVP